MVTGVQDIPPNASVTVVTYPLHVPESIVSVSVIAEVSNNVKGRSQFAPQLFDAQPPLLMIAVIVVSTSSEADPAADLAVAHTAHVSCLARPSTLVVSGFGFG